jgi:GDP-L-fucose synthase
MNVGLGNDVTINDYYNIAAEVIGYSGKFVHDLSKPVGMKRKLVSVDKLQAWGWQAKTRLQDGLAATYQYYLKDYQQ